MDYEGTISYDDAPECPMEWDGSWTLVSFDRNSVHYGDRDLYFRETADGKTVPADIGLLSKFRAGLAFALDKFDDWQPTHSIAGHSDLETADGILLWNHKPSEMGAKTFEDRRKDATAFLKTYDDWANGNVAYYSLEERGSGEHVDSCGGFYSSDNAYMTDSILFNLEPGDRLLVQGECEYLFDEKRIPDGVEIVQRWEEEETDGGITDETCAAMMRAVWMNPEDDVTIGACADALSERFGWSRESALSHANYHADRSIDFRVRYGYARSGDYDNELEFANA